MNEIIKHKYATTFTTLAFAAAASRLHLSKKLGISAVYLLVIRILKRHVLSTETLRTADTNSEVAGDNNFDE